MTNRWPLARRRVPEREAFAFAVTTLVIMFAGDGIPNTISWGGWAAVCGIAAVWGVVLLIRARPPLIRTPRSLWFLLAWWLLSVLWSHWRVATLASFAVQLICILAAFVIASTLSWRRILDAASLSLRSVLAVSLLFELAVAVIVRHPVAPVWSDYGTRKVPDAFYFSRAELFTGGRIQGLPGNANLLAMVALLATIVVAVQLAERRIRRNRAIGWLVLCALTLGLTRSSTVIVAAVVCAVVLGAALAIRRIPTERRTLPYAVGILVALALAAAAWAARGVVPHLLGRSEDLTGRGVIWARVSALAEHHPVHGWGWIGYWWPNVEPLGHLIRIHGVTYLQAHDAYLDIWMQTGIVGLILFALYVFTALFNAWASATRIAYDVDLRPQRFTPASLLPLLIVTALVVQSFAESRMLYGPNFILFAIMAIKARIVLVGEEPGSIGDGPRPPTRMRAFRVPTRR